MAACRAKNPIPSFSTEMPPVNTIEPSLTPTYYPEPEESIIYPSEEIAVTPYPISVDNLSSSGNDSYPSPNPYTNPYPEPNPYPSNQTETYPLPTRNQENNNNLSPTSYPEPGSDNTQEVVPGSSGSITEPTPEPVQVVITTPTPFPILLQKTILATDPGSVQLVSDRVQFIMFFAFWDGISKAMAPAINFLSEEYSEDIGFIFLDIDDPSTGGLKKYFKYQYQPEYYLINKEGMIIQKWTGFVDESELRAKFNEALR